MYRAALLIGFLGSLCINTAFSNVEVMGSATDFDYGKELTLSCNASGITMPPAISWYHNGVEIVEGDKSKYIITNSNGTLRIMDAVEADAGSYTCNFTMGSTNHGKELFVNAAPFVKAFEAESKNLVQGDPLVLTCKAWGFPKPTVTWFKSEEGKPETRVEMIADGNHVKFITSEEFAVANDTLRIEDLDYDDRADYFCEACAPLDPNGEEFGFPCANATILLRVKDKLAALWPFLGICFEVVILCIIIFVYEHRRAKKMAEEEPAEETGHLTNSNDHKGKDDVRHRK